MKENYNLYCEENLHWNWIQGSLSFRKSIFGIRRPEVFCKKRVLRNLAKLTGKHLCQSIFFNKVAGLRHRCFPVNFVKFLRTPFLTEHLRWLLLYFTIKFIFKADIKILMIYMVKFNVTILDRLEIKGVYKWKLNTCNSSWDRVKLVSN